MFPTKVFDATPPTVWMLRRFRRVHIFCGHNLTAGVPKQPVSTRIPADDNNFPTLAASLFWRCLAASTSSFLHAAMNLRPPSVTVCVCRRVYSYIIIYRAGLNHTEEYMLLPIIPVRSTWPQDKEVRRSTGHIMVMDQTNTKYGVTVITEL